MTKHLIITGLVQGVGYRATLARQAEALHLAGWVRNRSDGSVEALLAGAPEAIEQLIAWSRRGPPGARVDRVTVTDAGDGEAAADFHVRPTV